MIIGVKKYLILGAKEEIDQFFATAQKKGVIEFIPPHGKKTIETPLEIQHLVSAMRILRKLPVKKPYEGGGDLEYADEIAQRILEIKGEVERLSEEKRLLESEIVRVAPFGDFSLEDIDFIEKKGKCEIQFFCMKTAKSHLTNISDELIFIGSVYDLDYFIAIGKEPHSYPGMIEMRIDRPLGELQTHLSFVKESLHQIEAELKGYAGHLDFLHEAFVERLNDFNLLMAKKEVTYPLENSLFAIEAWIPSNKVSILYSIIDGMAIHCEPILIETTDRVPTYMENKGVQRIGEDLVKIYDIPATTDKDPSGWVFWFFALFFAMIVADGGYGLIYLGLCLYLRFKYRNLRGSGKRLLNLATILATSCIIWGILTSAFFGIQISPKSWFSKISIMQYLVVKKADYHLAHRDDVYQFWVSKYSDLSNVSSGREFLDTAVVKKGEHLKYEALDAFSDTILLELSLMIGVIHISLSLLRYLRRHWAGIGWVTFMIGAYLYFPLILKATSMIHFLGLVDRTIGEAIGLQLIYTGIAVALFLAIVQKRLKGIGEIATLIQVFADVLSYLRLYALGLAGAIMAETFNDIGVGVGLFLGVLVILVGHSVNIMLGIMSGMIHGLRLNFIEWYHYSFDGGGRLFHPLIRLKIKEHI
ncbi:MAG: V-type ATP synthase subunit I [Rhabdochlamydiaceae bacterium]|jgi:V/A-type H+-transporting ATPase subunit I